MNLNDCDWVDWRFGEYSLDGECAKIPDSEYDKYDVYLDGELMDYLIIPMTHIKEGYLLHYQQDPKGRFLVTNDNNLWVSQKYGKIELKEKGLC